MYIHGQSLHHHLAVDGMMSSAVARPVFPLAVRLRWCWPVEWKMKERVKRRMRKTAETCHHLTATLFPTTWPSLSSPFFPYNSPFVILSSCYVLLWTSHFDCLSAILSAQAERAQACVVNFIPLEFEIENDNCCTFLFLFILWSEQRGNISLGSNCLGLASRVVHPCFLSSLPASGQS